MSRRLLITRSGGSSISSQNLKMTMLKSGLGVLAPCPNNKTRTAVQESVLRSGAAAFGAFTIDVEDYFQLEAFAKVIDRRDWERQQPRIDYNTNRLLDILGE